MSWPLVELQNVCTLITDGTHYTPPDMGDGIPFLTVKDVSDSGLDFESSSKIAREEYVKADQGNSAPKVGDVLFSKDGTVGKVHVVKESREFAVLSSLAILRPNSSLNSDYFGYVLKSKSTIEQASKNKTGSALRRIILSDLKRIKIPLPPLAEQKRIAVILDKADAIRRKRQQAIQLADDFLRAVFLEMFGDPVTNPKGWEVKPLKDLAHKIGSGSTPRGGSESYQADGISLIRSLNIHDNEFKFKDLAFIDDEQAERLSNVVVEENDVLLNITGASVCRCAIVPSEVLPARVNQHVCIIRPKTNIYPSYLLHLLISQPYKQMLLQMSGAGATREALTKQQIENLQIATPPVSEQEKFEKVRVSLNSLIKNAQNFDSHALFKSLSQKAFSGQL